MAQSNPPGRRNFIYYLAAGMGALALGGAVWPLLDSMNPAADESARNDLKFDLSKIKPGERTIVASQGKPLYIFRRTPEQLQKVRSENWQGLRDPESDQSRVIKGHDEWLVVIGICTRHACIVKNADQDQGGLNWGGWFCPCCGARYDMSGRARSYPAGKNLLVPSYIFLDDKTILITRELNL